MSRYLPNIFCFWPSCGYNLIINPADTPELIVKMTNNYIIDQIGLPSPIMGIIYCLV